MIGESQNPTHEVYIDGFGLEGDFIPYNTGVDIKNKINSIKAELTTGKSFVKYLNENSTPLEFKTILTEPLVEDGYEDLLISVVDKASKEPVKIMFNGHSFMGMVLEFSMSVPPNAYREYDWLILETKPFEYKPKNFNTFNYKKSSTDTKLDNLFFPPTVRQVLECNPKYNCGKFKVSCVIAWQTYLTDEGYYGAKGYKIDGQYCTYTKSETERWQVNHKIKKTGEVDKATKDYLIKEYGITKEKNDIIKSKAIQTIANKTK